MQIEPQNLEFDKNESTNPSTKVYLKDKTIAPYNLSLKVYLQDKMIKPFIQNRNHQTIDWK